MLQGGWTLKTYVQGKNPGIKGQHIILLIGNIQNRELNKGQKVDSWLPRTGAGRRQ